MVGQIVVLVSGSGSNMVALADACDRREVPGSIVAVVADRACTGLDLAAQRGIETDLCDFRSYDSRSRWNDDLRDRVAAREPDLVVAAGFMRILAPSFVDAFSGRLINLHPSLLPAFPGAHAVRDALAHGVKVTGTTVHLVDHEVDHGPILLQEAVSVLPDDTEATLHERIKKVEHRLLPAACRLMLSTSVTSRCLDKMPVVEVRRALISVSDKAGVVDFASALSDRGIEILSSGGTAAVLAAAGVPVTPVADVTGAPEILGGRVKTLHPKIHGGILADRRKADHLRELANQGIEPIDLVVCNLYPFEQTVAHPSVTDDAALEQIDVGGPAMVRAAAKNHPSVGVVVEPLDYPRVLDEIQSSGGLSDATRRALAVKAFAHTSRYDAVIAAFLRIDDDLPRVLLVTADKAADLRYGENPHQSAAFYTFPGPKSGLAAAEQLGGKELSYNNLLDTDAAWKLALELEAPAAAIIKHSNPCGAAVAGSLVDAYRRALECDRTSAFGGIVALNDECDLATATAIAEIFTEVVVAPAFDPDAVEALSSKKNLRILAAPTHLRRSREARSVAGGLLLQDVDPYDDLAAAKVVTQREPTDRQWTDLRFAWIVAKHVKSNAIVLAKDGSAVGIGAGQMSRVDSTELAARRAGDRAFGSVCASDAFFPFRDGLDAAVNAGATAVIQPGGSVRDEEVIAAADEHGIPMVFTGRRHFRH